MYLKSVCIRDYKCFSELQLEWDSRYRSGDAQSNWNVILGDNGSGKSTLLQAIALAQLSTLHGNKLLNDGNGVRRARTHAVLTADVAPDPVMDEGGRPLQAGSVLRLGCALVAPGAEVLDTERGTSVPFPSAELIAPERGYEFLFPSEARAALLEEDVTALNRTIFSQKGGIGWLSCGFGAFRRLKGADQALLQRYKQLEPSAQRFVSLFEEGVALPDAEGWLLKLENQALKEKSRKSSARALFEEVCSTLTTLLPGLSDLHIDREVHFQFRGARASVSQLSDGYRSMFAMLVDLLRWMEFARGTRDMKLCDVGGMVLIDEVDAHLHPAWQREVGFWMTQKFPNIQFIVTSHSPFVAMAAGERGLTVLSPDQADDSVNATQDLPHVRGWMVDRVLLELFQLPGLRDPDTESKLAAYEALRRTARRRALTEEEQTDMTALVTLMKSRLTGSSTLEPPGILSNEDRTFLLRELRERMERRANHVED